MGFILSFVFCGRCIPALSSHLHASGLSTTPSPQPPLSVNCSSSPIFFLFLASPVPICLILSVNSHYLIQIQFVSISPLQPARRLPMNFAISFHFSCVNVYYMLSRSLLLYTQFLCLTFCNGKRKAFFLHSNFSPEKQCDIRPTPVSFFFCSLYETRNSGMVRNYERFMLKLLQRFGLRCRPRLHGDSRTTQLTVVRL